MRLLNRFYSSAPHQSAVHTRVEWLGGLDYKGTDSDGHSIMVSSSATGPGPAPMSLVIMGLGSCTIGYVARILGKQRHKVKSVVVEIESQKGIEGARPWEKIHLAFKVESDASQEQLDQVIDLSVNKYCGVHASLKGGPAHITFSGKNIPLAEVAQ